jgi:hypothetical protein
MARMFIRPGVMTCQDCRHEFPTDELLCAGSAENVKFCSVHKDKPCPEVYCESCFEADNSSKR